MLSVSPTVQNYDINTRFVDLVKLSGIEVIGDIKDVKDVRSIIFLPRGKTSRSLNHVKRFGKAKGRVSFYPLLHRTYCWTVYKAKRGMLD